MIRFQQAFCSDEPEPAFALAHLLLHHGIVLHRDLRQRMIFSEYLLLECQHLLAQGHRLIILLLFPIQES